MEEGLRIPLTRKPSSSEIKTGEGSGGPVDKGHVAYLIMFMMGTGFLFPWNAIMTAVDYFSQLYPHGHIDRTISVADTVANLCCISYLVTYGRRTSSEKRITFGFVAFLCLILLFPAMDWLYLRGARRGTWLSFSVTVGAVALEGCIKAVVQGTLFGVAGQLPGVYTQALLGGTAASGLAVCVLRILTKAALPPTLAGLRASANLYFLFAALFVAACIAAFEHFKRLPVIHHYRKLRQLASPPPPLHLPPAAGPAGEVPELPAGTAAADNGDAPSGSGGGPRDGLSEIAYLLDVVRHVWGYGLALVLIHIVSLSIMPGFLSEDVTSAVLGDWYPILLFFAYGLADLVAKVLPAGSYPRSTRVVLSIPVARLLFYPLFALARVGPPAFRNEAYVVAVTLGLGFSDGFCTAPVMMAAPSKVPAEQREAAGILMVGCVVIGLVLGSCASFLWLLI
eukprot:jgi/Mesen1/1319/ME000013S00810